MNVQSIITPTRCPISTSFIAMDFFKSIPGVEVAQVARPTPSKRRKYSIHLTEREAAETRLARPDNFCICCHNLRWRHLGDHSPTKIGDLKKSSYEGCHTCGLLLDWVDRLMRAHDERGDKVLGKGLRGKVKGVDLRFRETLELDISIEGFPRGLRWELNTLLGTCTVRFHWSLFLRTISLAIQYIARVRLFCLFLLYIFVCVHQTIHKSISLHRKTSLNCL